MSGEGLWMLFPPQLRRSAPRPVESKSIAEAIEEEITRLSNDLPGFVGGGPDE